MKQTIAAALVALAAASIAPPPAAHATGIPVFDVSNFAQALLDVQNGIDQIVQLKEQVTNQLNMLKSLPYTIMPDITDLLSTTRDLMETVDMIQSLGTDLESEIKAAFPTDAGDLTNIKTFNDALAKLEEINRQRERAARQAMEVQNQITANQEHLSSAVGAAVTASQGASGPTSAAQATNQLLAAMSQQLLELQSLTITASRAAETEALARASAEAVGRQETQRFLSTGSHTPTTPSESIF
ncbi:MAG: hypothetical protein PHS60_04610 [Zavarzinia sp.]|nr:hypothetical protein [Zavarzinia sp.]